MEATMYVLCFIFPPLAALISGGILSFCFNVLLTLFFYIPGVIHAFMVVNNAKAEKRAKQQIAAIEKQTQDLKGN
jgi:uncharacterized membrane protein YqaE (UPF0057 family)